MSCVTTTKAVPSSRASCSISSNTVVARCGGRGCRWARRPARSSACVTSARAIATRWRSPPDSCAGRCSTRADRPDAAPASPARLARRVHRFAPDAQRHRHVVERAELRQQVVELVDEAEVLVAPAPLLRPRPCVAKSRPISSTRPAVGCVEAAQQVQQRALARARGADDRQRLAARAPPGSCRCSTVTSSASLPLPSRKRLCRPRRPSAPTLTHSAAPRRDSRGWRASSGRAWRRTPATSEMMVIGTMSAQRGSLGMRLIR